MTGTNPEPPVAEYGCYDCGMGVPFLDALVVFLLVVPVTTAVMWIGYRMLTRFLPKGDEGPE